MDVADLQLGSIRERFFKLNSERIERTQELMPSTQRDLLSLLPLMFHINRENLPGYMDDKVPNGVYDFALDDELIAAARRQWPAIEVRRAVVLRYDIDAMFLMGSCGTVAFSRKSDFDVWLCHRPELSKDALSLLNEKAKRIEKWFDALDMEVHFFLMNADAFKQGKVTNLSTESSGTAQHRLLLDEFYRSSIWLAGKTPFWWYVPPEMEKKYDKLLLELSEKGVPSSREVIDFGGLADIPTGEFFGAAVWQIYKGIDSPYKSILKITLMESYASSYPKNTPLSAEFKRQIYQNITDPDALDPYLSMLRRIESHLINIKEGNRIEVIRRSFYLKLNILLSRSYEKNSWRKKYIEKLVESWGWSKETIRYLDDQKNWRLEEVAAERKLLMMNLIKSYSYLSGFARKNSEQRLINQKDLSILGRKLYAVFDRKPGKIEIFNRGIVDNIREESITIMLLHGKDSRSNWRLYRGRVTGDQFKKIKPLKQVYSLVELAAWMHFNQLLSDTTQKLLYAPGSEVTNTEFNLLLDILGDISLVKNAQKSKNKALLQPAYVQKSQVFLNIGKPVNIVGSSAERQIISGDIDVMNHGASTECLVQTIEYCYISSWSEVFIFKYYGSDGIAVWLCDLLDNFLSVPSDLAEVQNIMPEVYCFGSHISHTLSGRFTNLAQAVLNSYRNVDHGTNCYIYEAGKQIYCLHNENGKFDYSSFDGTTSLMEHMSRPSEQFRSMILDEFALQGSALRTVFSRNEKNIIQLFCHNTKDGVAVYILDEMGTLFYQKMPLDNLDIVVQHFVNFIVAISEKNYLLQGRITDADNEAGLKKFELEIYRLTKSQYYYKARFMKLPESIIHGQYDVQVVGSIENKKTIFTFYCDGAEFSTAYSGNAIFQVVAKHIYKQRRGGKKYYAYITSLELSPAILGKKSSQTVQIVEYLKYKKKIEANLNKALMRL